MANPAMPKITIEMVKNLVSIMGGSKRHQRTAGHKTAKELYQIQNGNGGSGSKPMSAIRAKLEAIKKEKVSAIKKEKSASDGVHQLLATLSKPDKAPVRKPKAPACKPAKALAKDKTADLIKQLFGALQATQANNSKAKAKVQEWDPDSDDEEESDESEEE